MTVKNSVVSATTIDDKTLPIFGEGSYNCHCQNLQYGGKFIMKTFHIAGSKVRVVGTNTYFPVPIEVTTLEDLKKAALYDHTCGQFRGDKLNTENFI